MVRIYFPFPALRERVTKTFSELLDQLTEDVWDAFSETDGTEVTIEHIESNRARNESTFRIQGNAKQLFPQLEGLDTDNARIETLKLTVSPNTEYIDYSNAEYRDC